MRLRNSTALHRLREWLPQTCLIFFIFTICAVLLLPKQANAQYCQCFTAEGEEEPVDAAPDCSFACGGTDWNFTYDEDYNPLCQCDVLGEDFFEVDCEGTCASAGYSTESPTVDTNNENETKPLILPALGVDVPTPEFSANINEKGILETNFISAYISGVYKFLIGASVTIAIVMVMIGGVQYVLAGASQQHVSKGKERIVNAISGLILLLSVYVILYTVNPELVLLRNLTLTTIRPHTIILETVDQNLQECQDIEGIVRPCTATEIVNPGGKWTDELVAVVNDVASSKGVDPFILATHLEIETGGDANWGRQRGPCGEIGPAQFMPYTFDAIVGGEQCCINYADKSGAPEEGSRGCTAVTDGWPPDTSIFPPENCQIDRGCGNCAIAAESCVDYFDTSKVINNKSGIQRVIEAQADLVAMNLRAPKVHNDIALEFCAYNGSGKHAAEYAQNAAQIYAEFCSKAGGTQR